ncbi:hypothetical protein [Acinetobacter sp. Tr-809]|uniref:hypothetical protein n=1 Tax=Acinetobacter sp. Tr-809 TaxID=2608324 RepID=UPI0014238D36|nr:hypothetical protein [Acinetobacter sp. Tr-809]
MKTLDGQLQVYFSTSQDGRYVDQLVGGIANESKVGYTSLTSGVRNQIAKDAELIKSRDIDGATWNFFTSPVTGRSGPSAQLRRALENAGIKIKEHY